MSATGTIDGLDFLVSKTKPGGGGGKPYAKVSIDGSEYLAFGERVEALRRASIGSTVQFSAKPTDSGDGQMLTFVKVTGGSVANKAPVVNSGNFGQRPSHRGGNDAPQGRGDIQLSIFYGYAKDLVAHGILKPAVVNPAATVDLISTTAKELMRRFTQDSGNEAPTPTQDIVVETNPL